MFDTLSAAVGGTAAIVIIVLAVFTVISWAFLPFILLAINSNLKDIYNLLIDISEENEEDEEDEQKKKK